MATDIAARGIDIDELSHVINYELPNIPESYVHRIGRTGRAGASGIAIGFCDAEEKEYLRDIQKLIGKQIDVIENHDYPLMNHTVVKTPQKQRPARSQQQRNPSQNSQDKVQGSTHRNKPENSAAPKKKSWYGEKRYPKN